MLLDTRDISSWKEINRVRLAIAAGGTGGHIFPSLAVIEALEKSDRDTYVVFFGRRSGMEKDILGGIKGVKYCGMKIRPFIRRKPLSVPLVALDLAASIWQARRELKRFQPDVVLGMGGYVSAPAVLAAVLSRFPVAIAEQNVLPGQVNRWMARWVDRVFYAYQESEKFLQKGNTRLTGIPLRESIINKVENPPYRQFGLDEDKFTILIFGGSQGARALCEAAFGMADYLDHSRYQVLLQAGKRNLPWCAERDTPENFTIVDHIQDMAGAYGCADVVVSRAGAVSLAEMAVQGKPALLVPYPFAKDDHQRLNAKAWENTGAGKIIDQLELSGETLAREILALAKDTDTLQRMSAAGLSLAIPDATQRIIKELEELTKAQ